MHWLGRMIVGVVLGVAAWPAGGHPVGPAGPATHDAAAHAEADDAEPVPTGSGAFAFRTVPGWGAWPAGVATATHGGVAVAADGRVFVGTESPDTGIVVFDRDGGVSQMWRGATASAHALSLVVDTDGTETLLAAHTKAEQIVRYSLDGTVLATIDGADDPEVSLKGVTAVAGLPDGTVFAATGYGASEVFRFAPDGTLVKKSGRKGGAHEDFRVTHGLTIDGRFGAPRLLMADREKGRLVHLSTDLEFLGVYAEGLRRPCVVALRGDHAAVAELQGRVSVLDRDGATVATLGDNPDQAKWAKFKLAPADLEPGVFTAPHGIAFAPDGGLIVQDYYQHGRVTRLAPVAAGAVGAAGPKSQPDILWIITDDQRADALACVNRARRGTDRSALGFVSSPRTDALAAMGTLFTRANCNAPVCGATRASMITGAYPHHNGRYAFETSHMRSDVSRATVPQVLRGAGYVAASFGKSGFLIDGDHFDADVDANELKKHGLTDFQNRSERTPGDWSPEGLVFQEEVFRGPGGEEAFFTHKAAGLSEDEEAQKNRVEGRYDVLRAYTRELSQLIVGGESPQPAEKTLDGEIFSAFTTHLDRAGEDYETPFGKAIAGPDPDRPLFTHLSFHLPHTPVLPPRTFRAKFADQVYDLPEFDRGEVSRMPEWARNIFVKMNFVDMTPEDQQQAIRDYYAFCAFGDDLVGRAVDRFRAYSESRGREWLVVYVVGDHGWHLGEQGIHGKFAPWLASTSGAVLAVSSDTERFPAGAVCDLNVEYVDLATTIYRAAGITDAEERMPFLDGVPLDATLHGEVPERPYVLTQLNHVTGPWASLRTRDLLFGMKTRPFYNYPPGYAPNENVRWGLDAPMAGVQPVLYDLRVDPGERCNLADVPEYAALAGWFRTKLGRIVLGDGRVEVDWTADNSYAVSDFAPGADDKKLAIPAGVVPDADAAGRVLEREMALMLAATPGVAD